MSERWRCSRCSRLVPEGKLTEHPKADRIRAASETSDFAKLKLAERHHKVMRSQSAGGGRIGSRMWMDSCGPVVLEQVDDYVLQIEHLLGETT